MFHAFRARFFERGRIFEGLRRMAMDEPGQEPQSPEDARLKSLNQRLRQAQLEEAARKGKPDLERSRQLVRSTGMRILSDLVGLPLGGGLIGWLIDRAAGTTPWFMLGGLFLGFGLAVRNVMRIAKQGQSGSEGS